MNLAGAFRGLGVGLTQASQFQLEQEEKQRAADLLYRRQVALEGARQQREDMRAATTQQAISDRAEADRKAAADRQLDGEVLAQSLRELDQLGIDPSSKEGKQYIQDRALDAQGPTATATTRRGQDVSERNNIRTTGTSRANNREDNATSRRNHDQTPVETVISGKGEPTVVYRNGRTQPMHDARLPGTRDRGGVGRVSASPSGAPAPPPMPPTKGMRIRDRNSDHTWVADGTAWHMEG